MTQVENTLPQGFCEANPDELMNVEGGFLGLALLVIACVIVGCEGKAR